MHYAKNTDKGKNENTAIATIIMLECAVISHGVNSVVRARNKRKTCQPADEHSLKDTRNEIRICDGDTTFWKIKGEQYWHVQSVWTSQLKIFSSSFGAFGALNKTHSYTNI